MVLVGAGRVRDARDDAAEPRLARQRQVLDPPLHDAREPEQREQRADDREQTAAPPRAAAFAAARVGKISVCSYSRFMPNGSATRNDRKIPIGPITFSRNFAAVASTVRAAEARRVVERVAVETERARQEGADEAADQERAEDVAERQLDALAAQQDRPAIHRRQDADELDAGRRARRRSRRCAASMSGQRVEHQPVGDHLRAVFDLHRVREQQPEDAQREPEP